MSNSSKPQKGNAEKKAKKIADESSEDVQYLKETEGKKPSVEVKREPGTRRVAS